MKKSVLFILFLQLICMSVTAAEYKAVDGDSLVQGERRIRLDGIDAPEFTQTCFNAKNEEYACGLFSLQYLERLLADKKVHCNCLPYKDKYKREICECYAGKISLNQNMISSGNAVSYRSEKYIKDEIAAKSHKQGMWQGKFMRPALYRALERLQNQSEPKKISNQKLFYHIGK